MYDDVYLLNNINCSYRMSDQSKSDILIIIESINLAFTLVFLLLFSYRLRYLHPFSRTNKYSSNTGFIQTTFRKYVSSSVCST